MKLIGLLILVQIFSSFAFSDPLYITVKGEVSRVLDRTTEKELGHVSIGDIVQYTFLIDDELQGFHYLKNGNIVKAEDKFTNLNFYQDYSFADYTCGDLINSGYYGKEYFLAMSKKSSSSERLIINVGKRLDVELNSVLENISIGDSGESYNYIRPADANTSQSLIQSNIQVVSIDFIDPCHN